MTVQTLAVSLIVVAGMVYALWQLMPQAVRRPLAKRVAGERVARWLPGPLRVALQRAATQSSGCGCDGCDRAAPAPTKASDAAQGHSQPIVFHPRKR